MAIQWEKINIERYSTLFCSLLIVKLLFLMDKLTWLVKFSVGKFPKLKDNFKLDWTLTNNLLIDPKLWMPFLKSIPWISLEPVTVMML